MNGYSSDAASDDDEMLQEAIRQSLESVGGSLPDNNYEPSEVGQNGNSVAGASTKRKRVEVVEISDSDDDAVVATAPKRPAGFKVVSASSSTDVAGKNDPGAGVPASRPTGPSFLFDRAAMEKERLARQQKQSSQTSSSGGSQSKDLLELPATNSKVSSFPALAANSVPLNPKGSTNTGRFWQPEIYFTWVQGFPSTERTVKLPELLDSKNLRRGFVSSYDWDIEYLFDATGPGPQLWLAMPPSSSGPLSQPGVYNYPNRASTLVVIPRMNGPFGAMHSKLMVLDFGAFVRIVIPSCNMGARDWEYVENTVFVQDFRKLSDVANGQPAAAPRSPQSNAWMPTFGEAMLDYVQAMGCPENALQWMRQFDYTTEAQFVGTKPVSANSPLAEQRDKYGLNRLANAARQLGFQGSRDIKVEFATSSLGSLKPAWIEDFGRAASGLPFLQPPGKGKAKQATLTDQPAIQVNFLFPSRRTVHESRSGKTGPGTATCCWERKYWEAEPTVANHLRDYISARTGLISHSKFGVVEDLSVGSDTEVGKVYGLRYCGSANFTVAAWGKRTKDGLREAKNWETGVLLASKITAGAKTLSGGSVPQRLEIPRPYAQPLVKYRQGDVPWFRYEELNFGPRQH